ncbi:MAG: hypothetical protein ACOYON_12325 [Fimbriimonas sp.]
MRWYLALSLAPLALGSHTNIGEVASQGAPSAIGRGGFNIQHDASRKDSSFHEIGTASVNFKFYGGSSPSGTMLYAAEDHHESRYPHVVVRLSQIKSLTFEGKTAHVLGEGEYHDEVASIEVIMVDSGLKTKGDRFTIRVRQGDMVMYERSSELGIGDIQVNP